MNESKNIEAFISKFLNKEATAEDLKVLETALKKEKNQKVFNKFVKINYLSNTLMENFDVIKAKSAIKNKIKDEKRRLKLLYLKRSIAVAAVLLLGFFIFKITDVLNGATKEKVIVNTIKPGTDKAVLTLENGEDIILEKNKALSLPNSNVKGKEIVYNNDKVAKKEAVIYNYLTIPRGGQYFVVLSDGTKVWLNSESKLKYPVKFAKNELREVTLLYGEAYFDVSPSTKHNGAKFKVNTKNQQVIVYGTQFNVKAYDDSDKIYTTLVEGSISIDNGSVHKKITPDSQAIISNKGIEIKKDIDVLYEVAWKNGTFMFYKERLDDMLISLSRWYDVEVFYDNEAKKKEIFSGLLKRTDNIEELLNLLQKTGAVTFTIEDNKITVK